MMLAPKPLLKAWPLVGALASIAMLAIAHAFETFGHLVPCELCLKQREVYWVALAVGLVGFALGRALKRPLLINLSSLLLGLIFLYGAGLAGYHAGVEWKWWPGPQSCTSTGAGVDTAALADLLKGAQVKGPNCDKAAWRFVGISMAGWNALISLKLAILSAVAVAHAMKRHDRV